MAKNYQDAKNASNKIGATVIRNMKEPWEGAFANTLDSYLQKSASTFFWLAICYILAHIVAAVL